MVSGDEPELDAFVHDAHAVFGLDALVAVPDHVLVEHRGELVDRHAPEAPLVEELLLETAEEPLRGRIVRRTALRAHRPGQPVLGADADPFRPPVMATPVRVDDRRLAGLERGARVAKHAVGQGGVGARADRPGDGHAVVAVDDRRQVHLARRDRELGDVRDPQPVRRGGVEVAVHEIRGCAADLALVRTVALRALEHGDHAVAGHQAHDALGRHDDARAFELEVDALVPVTPPAAPERLAHQGQEVRVLVRPAHGLQLVVVRAARDADLLQQALRVHAQRLTDVLDQGRLLSACRVVRVCARLFSHQFRRTLHDRQPDLHGPLFGAQTLEVGAQRGDLAAQRVRIVLLRGIPAFRFPLRHHESFRVSEQLTLPVSHDRRIHTHRLRGLARTQFTGRDLQDRIPFQFPGNRATANPAFARRELVDPRGKHLLARIPQLADHIRRAALVFHIQLDRALPLFPRVLRHGRLLLGSQSKKTAPPPLDGKGSVFFDIRFLAQQTLKQYTFRDSPWSRSPGTSFALILRTIVGTPFVHATIAWMKGA